MKKASRFREAFLITWSAACVPLPSRPHARPRNEDDDDDAKQEVALHVRLVNATGCGRVNAYQAEMCTLHSTDRVQLGSSRTRQRDEARVRDDTELGQHFCVCPLPAQSCR